MSLYNVTIKQIENMLHKKEISAEELAGMAFEQIEKVDDDIKAFLTLNKEGALEKAKQIDKENGYDKKLAAIPGAIKDNIVTKGLRTTCASKILENFDPIYDATVVQKLQQAETVTIGKLNMDEFAMGSSNENSALSNNKESMES